MNHWNFKWANLRIMEGFACVVNNQREFYHVEYM